MAPSSDMNTATKTYAGFVTFIKWGTIISFGLGAVVVLLIAT